MSSPTGQFRRYVALGDSFTEGVGDPDPLRPNGVRGWADRVAEQLSRHDPDFRYANLAVRGRLLDPIVDEQLDTAIAMEPDLITIYAGGNDLMRPGLDVDDLIRRYERALMRLTATGATVVAFTACDVGWAPVFRWFRGRTAVYNELLREVAERHGVLLLDFWRLTDYHDYRMWDVDRLHMSTAGHERMAAEVLDLLGVEHLLGAPLLPPDPAAQTTDLAGNAEWVRIFLAPWLYRRLRGTSSGDGLSPRRPDLQPLPESVLPTAADTGPTEPAERIGTRADHPFQFVGPDTPN